MVLEDHGGRGGVKADLFYMIVRLNGLRKHHARIWLYYRMFQIRYLIE